MAASHHPSALLITDCDRLAANPPDPDRVAPGVARENIDVPRAIDACRAAVAAHPETARLSYQLGRCLFYAGHITDALVSFSQAASLGYRQAHFILGLIIMRRYEGVPFDLAKVEYHWRAAAALDHAVAQVSYVRSAIRGDFSEIKSPATPAEMKNFLERARPKVDYLASLLVDDLLVAMIDPPPQGSKK